MHTRFCLRAFLHSCHCFLHKLSVEPMFLTAVSQGQLGLTMSEHLETPQHTRVTRNIPHPTHELHTYWGSYESFLCHTFSRLSLPLMLVFQDADPVNAVGWKGWFGTGLSDLYSSGYGSWLNSFLFGLMLEWSCHPWGQLVDVGSLTRGPPPVAIKWFMEGRHNPSSCRLYWIVKPYQRFSPLLSSVAFSRIKQERQYFKDFKTLWHELS